MTGFINIDKAEGVSSAKEVARIKRLTGTPCGHLGTLDPMASGVLPIAIGNSARLFDYFLNKRKTYVATFRFGEDYDTLDTTGTLLNSDSKIPDIKSIEGVIPSLIGDVMQIPPNYSAKCINGKRGYQLARQGVQFSLEPKKVSIHSIKLLKQVDERSFSFEIECGSGTYIRSIARDMAVALGTYGAMSALVRCASGPFTLDDSVQSDELTEDNIGSFIIPTEKLLPFESFFAEGKTAKRLFNGLPAECGLTDGTYKLYNGENNFYGLAVVENGLIKVRTKLC